MNLIFKQIKEKLEVDDVKAMKIARAWKNLLMAIHGKDTIFEDLAEIRALSYMTTNNGLDELARTAKLYEHHLFHPEYRYVISKYDGAGGATTFLHNTLEEVLDSIYDMCFTDDEMTGQFNCYDLHKAEDITDQVRGYVMANRLRYAVACYTQRNGDETYEGGQASTLDEAKKILCGFLEQGIGDYGEIFDRENGKCVWGDGTADEFKQVD